MIHIFPGNHSENVPTHSEKLRRFLSGFDFEVQLKGSTG